MAAKSWTRVARPTGRPSQSPSARGKSWRTVRIGLATLATSFVLAIGCGSERPPVSDGSGYVGNKTATGDIFNTDAGGIKPPGCGTKPDGSQCDCVDVPLFTDPPNIYFVLDRSGSMEQLNKWTQVRITIGKIMRGLGPRANFGAAMFPATTGATGCAPGAEIMSVRPGDPPSSTADGPTTLTLLTATRVTPAGGTPTGATLVAVRPNLEKLTGRTFVILATDGAPNCNSQASCGFDQCQLNIENVPGCSSLGPANCCEPPDGYRENCNDGPATIGAIGQLKTVGIPTYVVGLPGGETYATLLDQMATAGGTAQGGSPKYFAVNSATESVMLAALKKIAAQITGTCVFDLKTEPKDPSLVNVYMDDVAVPFEPSNGWTIAGKTVTLVGDACNRVKSGDVLDVRIIAGCPRLEPK